MKKILSLIIAFSVFFCVQGIAQDTRDSKISNKTTFKGKRQLRKEKRIQRNASTVTASNAKAAKKRNAKGGLPRSSRKQNKKEKNKQVVIEERLAKTEPKKD